MTNQELVAKLHRAQAIRDRFYRLRRVRIEAAFRQANLGDVNMCSLHNCLISAESGQPWREINYSAARRANWLINTQWHANELVERLYKRLCREMRQAA